MFDFKGKNFFLHSENCARKVWDAFLTRKSIAPDCRQHLFYVEFSKEFGSNVRFSIYCPPARTRGIATCMQHCCHTAIKTSTQLCQPIKNVSSDWYPHKQPMRMSKRVWPKLKLLAQERCGFRDDYNICTLMWGNWIIEYWLYAIVKLWYHAHSRNVSEVAING